MKTTLRHIILFILLSVLGTVAMDVPTPRAPEDSALSFKTRMLLEFQKEGWVTIASASSSPAYGCFVGQKGDCYKILSIEDNDIQSQEFQTFEGLFAQSPGEIDLNSITILDRFFVLSLYSPGKGSMLRFIGWDRIHRTNLFRLHTNNPLFMKQIRISPYGDNGLLIVEKRTDSLHVHSLSYYEVKRSITTIPRKPTYQLTAILGDEGGNCIAFLGDVGSGRSIFLHDLRTKQTRRAPFFNSTVFDALCSLQFCTDNHFIISQKVFEFGSHSYLYPEVINLGNPLLAGIINAIITSEYFKTCMAMDMWGNSANEKGTEALMERFHSHVSIGRSPITIFPPEEDKAQVFENGIVLPVKIELFFSGCGEYDYTLRIPLCLDQLTAVNAQDYHSQNAYIQYYISSCLTYIMQSPTQTEIRQFGNNLDPHFKFHKFMFDDAFCPYWVLHTPHVSSNKKPLIYYVEGGPKTIKMNPVKNRHMLDLAENGFFIVSANYPGSTFSERSIEIAEGKCLSLSMSYFSQLHQEIMRTYGEFIDKDKIAMVGGSYGGSVTLMHSYDWEGELAPNLKACVVTCPSLREETASRAYNLGGSPHMRPDRFAHSMNKPTLLIQGKQDPTCHYKDTLALVERIPASLKDQFLTFISLNNMGHGSNTVEQETLQLTSICQFLRYHLNYWEGPDKYLTALKDNIRNIDALLENAFATVEGGKRPLWMENLTEKAA